MTDRPIHLDIRRDAGMTLTWSDGSTSFLPVGYLRRMSPSADSRHLREEMSRNPLTVLPATATTGPLTLLDAELVGHYAVRLRFSDGHDTGLYSWAYLRDLATRQGESPRETCG